MNTVAIVACDPFATDKPQEPDKRQIGGLQTLPVLRLRTHPQHRMRLLLLNNLHTEQGWVNGTRVRLLEKCSWSGQVRKLRSVPHVTTKNVQQWSVAADAYTILADEGKYPEFNVKVVKDEDIVLKKTIRLDESDVQLIPVKTDETTVNGITLARKQVQAVPAYALTVHKSQGLTMLMVYLSLSAVFNFGQVYTALTRCPFKLATFLIGVPPKDILRRLLKKNERGETKIDLKRKEIQTLLADEAKLTP